ncbi:hypothetical protein [Deinococcus aquatilis]|uniref:hypothetical protein n=1 Tax=Deinococcus aquatilis TaxID=519440 RepID=UPI000371EB34|nr:hypothetical protein [Deinococcus aquatilis]
MNPEAAGKVRRRPCGTVIWDERQLQSLRWRLRQGHSYKRIGYDLGISFAAVNRRAADLGLNLPPEGEMFVAVVGRQVGVSGATIITRARQLGLTPRHWGICFTLTMDQAAEVVALWDGDLQARDAEHDGWLSAVDAAKLLGITKVMFLRRVEPHGVRRVRVLGVTGRAFRYHPQDVARLPIPVAPRGKPRGYLTGNALADLTGVPLGTLPCWRKRGMPSVQDRVAFHAHYYSPAAVLTWLEGQHRPGWSAATRARYEEARVRLREYLAQQRAA